MEWHQQNKSYLQNKKENKRIENILINTPDSLNSEKKNKQKRERERERASCVDILKDR